MYLKKPRAYVEQLEEVISQLSSHDMAGCKKALEILRYIEEDISLTENSFTLKDSIKTKNIIKKTYNYAEVYYSVRIHDVCQKLILMLNQSELPKKKDLILSLSGMQSQIQNNSSYSLSNQEAFINPYPMHLFFSQTWHSSHFSNKAQRTGISGEDLDTIAKRLKNREISPDYLRVNMYFAPLRGVLQPFVYNNRTWVVFSSANVEATRIVPIVPNQDLLNRIKMFSDDHNPNIIRDEHATNAAATISARSGRC